MKQHVFSILMILLSLSYTSVGQEKGYLTGTLNYVIKDSCRAILFSPDADKVETKIIDKKFKLKIPEGNLLTTYILLLGDAKTGNPYDFALPVVLNENSTINIYLDSQFYKYELTGDNLTTEQNQFYQDMFKIDSRRINLEAKLNSTDDISGKDTLKKLLNEVDESKDSLIRTWVINHSESPFAISLIRLFVLKNRDDVASKEAYQLLYPIPENIKNQSSDYKIILTDIYSNTRSEDYLNVTTGKDAPDFEIKDTSGNTITLKDFKGSYLLIDFWASWCGPCKQSLPMLRSITEDYTAKGLKVLGISMDKDKVQWVNSISIDKMTWLQGSDLKGQSLTNEDNISFKYEISGVPQFFIISPDGKILLRELGYGEKNSEKKIREVLDNVL